MMDGQPLIETKRHQEVEQIALRFEAMAAQIRLNKDGKFGGAFLLVPPLGTGAPVELMTISDQNPGHFWMSVKLFIDEQYKRVQDMVARQQGFG